MSFIKKDSHQLAYIHTSGIKPGIFFLGGFNSSMQGLKALAIEKYCIDKGIAFTRFDYSGHGQSSGDFSDGCISDWLQDALAVFDHTVQGHALIVGSSMGAWVGALLSLQRDQQVSGFIGLASALDFTHTLAERHLNSQQREVLAATGQTQLISCYDHETPYVITQKLITDGEQNCLLDKTIPINVPVHLLHGMADLDVPWQISVRFAEQLTSKQVELTLLKESDHRLSSPEDLAVIYHLLDKYHVPKKLNR